MSEMKLVDVAVAVMIRPDGEFLLAQRPTGKPYAGYWEFPGGKVEPGEAVYDALVREIREELGVSVQQAYPWITQIFSYPHARVKLHFYRVTQWQGELYPHENQAFSWQYIDHVQVTPLLPANGPVLKSLALPVVCGISQVAAMGKAAFLVQMETAIKNGLRMIQLRESQMPPDELAVLAGEALSVSRRYGAILLVNGNLTLAQATGADGVHLTSRQLLDADARPAAGVAGASCHNREELEHAVAIGLDYAVLSPVQPTLTHPGEPALGWQKFSELIKDISIPVYALGGLRQQDLTVAWQHGAHGIAMLRSAWEG